MRAQWRRQLPAQLKGPRPGGWAVGSIVWPPPSPASTGSAAAGTGLLAEAPSCSPHAGTPWPARPRLGLQPPWCCLPCRLLLLLASRGHCLGTWEDLAGGGRVWRPHPGVVRDSVHQDGTDREEGREKVVHWAGGRARGPPPDASLGGYGSVSFVAGQGRRVLGLTGCVMRPPLSHLFPKLYSEGTGEHPPLGSVFCDS